MKKALTISSFLIVAALFYSFLNKEQSKWKYKLITSDNHDTVNFHLPVFLNIHVNGSYSFSDFSVNECDGVFEHLPNDSISFQPADCTEACCETDNENSLIHLLPRMSTYKVDGDELIISGNLNFPIVFNHFKNDPDTLLGMTVIKLEKVE